MNNTDFIRNKNLYKIFLSILKFMPATLALIQMVCLLLNHLGLSAYILINLGGTSFVFIGMLFMMSYLFRFCYLYRIPLYYISIIGVVGILRNLGFIPIELEILYRIYVFITGLFISLFVGFMYRNRNNPKIDHIKQLCENYSNCCK